MGGTPGWGSGTSIRESIRTSATASPREGVSGAPGKPLGRREARPGAGAVPQGRLPPSLVPCRDDHGQSHAAERDGCCTEEPLPGDGLRRRDRQSDGMSVACHKPHHQQGHAMSPTSSRDMPQASPAAGTCCPACAGTEPQGSTELAVHIPDKTQPKKASAASAVLSAWPARRWGQRVPPAAQLTALSTEAASGLLSVAAGSKVRTLQLAAPGSIGWSQERSWGYRRFPGKADGAAPSPGRLVALTQRKPWVTSASPPPGSRTASTPWGH